MTLQLEGIKLGSRKPARITINDQPGRVSRDASLSLARSDSLEETRSYAKYGLVPAGDNRNLPERLYARPRSVSGSSRQSSGAVQARATSPAETIGASDSIRDRVFASHAASLPPPRGFLSPKSPQKRLQQVHHLGDDSFPPQKSSVDGFMSFEDALATPPDSPLPAHVKSTQFEHRSRESADGGHEKSSDHLIDRESSTRTWSVHQSTVARHVTASPSTPRASDGASTSVPKLQQGYRPSSSPVSMPKQRNYQSLPPSGITFLLHGRFMTGGDSPLPLLASVLLICGVSGCWLGTTGVWLWREGRRYGLGSGGIAVVIVFAYLLLSTLSSMAGAALRDPGILPRSLDLDPPVSHRSSTDSLIPLPREIKVRDESVTVKYCETCKLYRPPRSSHCRLCGNCVDGIDHHCTYLHTCVGKRNYVSFLAFVIWASVSTAYEVVFSAIHFALLCSTDNITLKLALARSPGAAVSFALGIVVVWPISYLLMYHLRLMYLNSTTIEQIRAHGGMSMTSNPSSVNPFQYSSAIRNLVASSLGRPRLPSWLDSRGWHTADERQPNPGVYNN